MGGRRLSAPRGRRVRPTSDRMRQSVFNILRDQLPGAEVLDLCAGTGAYAAEALSRGAASALAVESDRRVAAVAAENLSLFGEQARVWPADALRAIRRLGRSRRIFSLVFVDPPYDSPIGGKILQALLENGIVPISGRIIYEHRRGAVFERSGWHCARTIRSGGMEVEFLRTASAPDD